MKGGLSKMNGHKILGLLGKAPMLHGMLGVGAGGLVHIREESHQTRILHQFHGKDKDTIHIRRTEMTQPYSGPDPSKRKRSQKPNGWTSLSLTKMNKEIHMKSSCRRDIHVIQDTAVSIQK